MRSAKIKLELDPQLPVNNHPWANPVVPGDHPDPTIIRVGRHFWASSTSGEWSPQFPLFHSRDLISWTPAGNIFPVQPAWAEGSFWAPELVFDEVSRQTLAWYVAKKRDGPLCIAVATADSPGGPYIDHGPLICEADGAIDPCFARDEHGEPYLIWKEDGNSAGRPTPIWAQHLSADLLRLDGEKTELIRNDQPWEEGVVEGPYILRHRGHDDVLRFYMFYAGNSCCGKECKYAEGVARSEKLLGPWEKAPNNPLIGANDTWRCPGHGTAVHTSDKSGKPAQDYLLYHAYPTGGTIYVGREAVLDEITWPVDNGGWPQINAGNGPSATRDATRVTSIDFTDQFDTHHLGFAWQWPVNTLPEVRTGHHALHLIIPMQSEMAAGPVRSALVAVPRPASVHYRASVSITQPQHANPELWAGLSVIGDPFNTIGLGLRGCSDGEGHELVLWQRRGAFQEVLWQHPAPAAERLWLRSNTVDTGVGQDDRHFLQFSWSLDNHTWTMAGAVYDASELPAWDRGLRIGLMLEGPQGSGAKFHHFELRAQ